MTSNLTITHLRFDAVAEERIQLNGLMAGNYLRNGMASVMLRATCTETHRTAQPTPEHAATCPACWLLAAQVEPGKVRRAYSMAPPLPPRQRIEAGESFSFAISLYGEGLGFLPYFVLALTEVGRLGIGPGRGSFRVQQIQAVDPLRGLVQDVLRPGAQLVQVPSLHVDWQAAQAVASALAGTLPREEVTLHFLTPTRLTERERLVRMPDFAVLFRRLLERIDEMARQWSSGGRRAPEELEELYRYAEHVRLVDAGVKWIDLKSYSGRTKKERWFSGFVGRATYRSQDWLALLPWLILGQGVQVGKDTVRGNGMFVLAPGGGYWNRLGDWRSTQ